MILPVRGATSSASEHSSIPSIAVLRTLTLFGPGGGGSFFPAAEIFLITP